MCRPNQFWGNANSGREKEKKEEEEEKAHFGEPERITGGIIHFVLSTHNSQGISYHKYLHSVLIRTFAFASYQSASQALADSESCLHAIHTFLMSHVAGWYHILARTLSPKRGGHFLLELAHLGTVFEFFHPLMWFNWDSFFFFLF